MINPRARATIHCQFAMGLARMADADYQPAGMARVLNAIVTDT